LSRIRTRLKRGAAFAAGASAIAAVAVAPALSIAPGPPPGQGAIVTEAANTTPVVIDDGVGPSAPGPVKSSTVVVSGAGASLLDVDLETSISHTASQDLIVRLRSPRGTVTTITNGLPESDIAGYTDTFLGTRWDDSASAPVGSKDFGLPPGLPASDLIPLGAMGAFVGENPNGVWTLTVQDRDITGTGVLNGWDLRLTTVPKAPSTTKATLTSPSGAQLIPDNNTVVASSINVAGAGGYTYDVDVRTTLSHEETRDLKLSLKAPSGTIVPLSVLRGGGQWFSNTVWNDSAGSALDEQPQASQGGKPTLVPDGALGAVIGQNPNGTWQLLVQDAVDDGPAMITCPGDPHCGPTQMGLVQNNDFLGPGTLAKWELRLTVAGPPGKPPKAPVKPLTLKIAGGKVVKRGKRANFVYRVRNTTKKAIKSVVVTNTLPRGLTIDGKSRAANLKVAKKSLRYTGGGRKVTFKLGTIGKGKTVVIKVNAKVAAGAAKGKKTNTVTFRGKGVKSAKATSKVTIK
jgi:subtilisin-like proprotein convertase family protein